MSTEDEDGVCSICGDFVHVGNGDEPGPHWHCQIVVMEAALRRILRKRTLDNAKHEARVALGDCELAVKTNG